MIKVKIKESIMKDELTEKAKQKKKQCQAGNPLHDEDGRLASKEDNTSWSLSKPSGATDCTAGQSRMDKGSNKRKITKKDKRTKRCGRDKATGTSKSRYRCKDGSAVWQEGDDTQPKIRVRIRKKQKTESMILAMPPQWKEPQPIKEGQDELTVSTPTVSQTKSDDFVGIQGKYMKFINSLTPEERIQVRNLFCYDRFSLKQLNNISLASDGKLNEPPKK